MAQQWIVLLTLVALVRLLSNFICFWRPVRIVQVEIRTLHTCQTFISLSLDGPLIHICEPILGRIFHERISWFRHFLGNSGVRLASSNVSQPAKLGHTCRPATMLARRWIYGDLWLSLLGLISFAPILVHQILPIPHHYLLLCLISFAFRFGGQNLESTHLTMI